LSFGEGEKFPKGNVRVSEGVKKKGGCPVNNGERSGRKHWRWFWEKEITERGRQLLKSEIKRSNKNPQKKYCQRRKTRLCRQRRGGLQGAAARNWVEFKGERREKGQAEEKLGL